MCAAFDDGAMLKHENLVGLTNGAEAVGDHETGATLHQALESFLNQALGGGVDTGGGFIEDQNRRIGQQRARDADALFLAHTELHAAFAHA